jgi:predicted P-loop ATPase
MDKPKATPLTKVERERKKAEKQRKKEEALDAMTAPAEIVPSTHDGDWRALLMVNGEGKPSKTITNALVFLEHHEQLSMRFAMNALGLRPMVVRRPPWDQVGPFPRRLSGADVVKATAWLERKGVVLGRDTIGAVLETVCHDHTYDPIAEYLESVAWDGIERIDHWLTDFYGVTDSDAARAISRKFMIGSVARALRPGEKMDNILVLEGAQGLRKSMSIKVLFGREWTLETMEQIGTKDARQQIAAYWAVELPELDHLTKAQTSAVKGWLSTDTDDYRSPWGHFSLPHPRRCVFLATHNPGAAWLDDPTGARRFWVVECTKIDIDGLRQARDQLWAEAVAAYRKGDRWWFEEHEHNGEDKALLQIREAQRNRFQDDPWYNIVAEWLAGQITEFVTIESILEKLSIPKDRWDKMTTTRIGKIVAATEQWKKKDRGAGVKPRYIYERVRAEPVVAALPPEPELPPPEDAEIPGFD